MRGSVVRGTEPIKRINLRSAVVQVAHHRPSGYYKHPYVNLAAMWPLVVITDIQPKIARHNSEWNFYGAAFFELNVLSRLQPALGEPHPHPPPSPFVKLTSVCNARLRVSLGVCARTCFFLLSRFPFPSFNPRKPRPKPLIGHYLALALFYLSPPFFASPLKAIHTLFSLRLSPRPFLSLSQGISTDGVCTRSNAVWHADTCRPDGWRRDRNFGSTHEKESFLRSSPLNRQRESLEPTSHGKVSRYKSARRLARQPPGLGSQDSVGMIPDVEEGSPNEGVEGSFLYYVTPREDVHQSFPGDFVATHRRHPGLSLFSSKRQAGTVTKEFPLPHSFSGGAVTGHRSISSSHEIRGASIYRSSVRKPTTIR